MSVFAPAEFLFFKFHRCMHGKSFSTPARWIVLASTSCALSFFYLSSVKMKAPSSSDTAYILLQQQDTWHVWKQVKGFACRLKLIQSWWGRPSCSGSDTCCWPVECDHWKLFYESHINLCQTKYSWGSIKKITAVQWRLSPCWVKMNVRPDVGYPNDNQAMTNAPVTICERARQHCRQQWQSLQNGTALLQKDARQPMSSCLKKLDQTPQFLWSGEKTVPQNKWEKNHHWELQHQDLQWKPVRESAAVTLGKIISLSVNGCFWPSWVRFWTS